MIKLDYLLHKRNQRLLWAIVKNGWDPGADLKILYNKDKNAFDATAAALSIPDQLKHQHYELIKRFRDFQAEAEHLLQEHL